MFHNETIKKLINRPIHELLFYVFLFLLPIQTRILYSPFKAYIGDYFNYHLAFFFYLTDILLIACFVSWILFDKPIELPQKRLFWLTIAFFCLILVTLFHPPATPALAWRAGVKRLDLGWYQALKWAELLVLVLYISETFRTKSQLSISATVLFISSTIQAGIALIQFHVQHSLGLGFLGEYIAPLGTSGLATIETGAGKIIRAYGTFPHPNILGAFLVFGLILGLFLVSHPPVPNGYVRAGGTKVTKTLVLLGIFLIILGIFVTFSRLAWLSALLVLLSFMAYYWHKKQQSSAIVILLVAFVSCATIFGLFHQTLKARVSDASTASVDDRALFNGFGIELIKQNPWLGVGVGNYVPALQKLKPDLKTWQYQPPHNIFLFVGAELGVLGLGLFIAILGFIFWRLRRVSPEAISFAFVLLGIIFLIMGQFDHYFVTIQQGRLMFFAVLGIIAALPNIYAQRSD